jgi:mannose-6-phosphate isomerase-like protein (cupin superfamily)
MLEKITHGDDLIAIILSNTYTQPGIHFFTPNDLSQQLAYMKHPVGKIIQPHVHNPVKREVHYTQEVLFIRKGKLRVDLFDKQRNYLESRILATGDVILLATGGHGFEMLEETEMIEVKQGPYAGDADKTRFDTTVNGEIKFNSKRGDVCDVVETKF